MSNLNFSSPVCISSMSVASSLGNSAKSLMTRLRADETGVTYDHRFKQWTEAPLGVMDFSDFTDALDPIKEPDSVTYQILAGMIDQIAESSGLFQRYHSAEIGFLFGTTTLGLQGIQRGVIDARKDGLNLVDLLGSDMGQGWILSEIGRNFPIHGPKLTYSAACASGAMAIAEGSDLIRSGALKACLVGGIDILNLLTIMGFESLQVVDFDRCRPFSEKRKGINLGEGGALFLLEADPKDSPHGRVLSSGISSDAFHMTQPKEDGSGMALAMKTALERGAYQPNQIIYINAHGTGTIQNDQAESAAFTDVFGETQEYESTKALTGHALAGSGALEVAISLMRLRDIGQGGIALSNSFGFGGSNISLLLGGGE